MGSKQTKIEGDYLPNTPQPKQAVQMQSDDFKESVPWAANVTRTPMNAFHSYSSLPNQRSIYHQEMPIGATTKPQYNLRKRLLKGFTYNLNDPRSPSEQLNRTPLLLDALNDRTLNLDDTFSDLFVETRTASSEMNLKQLVTRNEPLPSATEPPKTFTSTPLTNQDKVISSTPLTSETGEAHVEEPSFNCEEETMASTAVLVQKPVIYQQSLDPRSPTIGLERTPIVFNDDDDEAREDAMLESILGTLSLDMSNASGSSLGSFGTPVGEKFNASVEQNSSNVVKPANKPLERVRGARFSDVPQRAKRQRIYEDNDLMGLNTNKESPLAAKSPTMTSEKRKPLSCMMNRSNCLRSRSVELSDKSLKTRLALTSFDDNLNPMQNENVSDLRIMQDSGDSFEF